MSGLFHATGTSIFVFIVAMAGKGMATTFGMDEGMPTLLVCAASAAVLLFVALSIRDEQ